MKFKSRNLLEMEIKTDKTFIWRDVVVLNVLTKFREK